MRTTVSYYGNDMRLDRAEFATSVHTCVVRSLAARKLCSRLQDAEVHIVLFLDCVSVNEQGALLLQRNREHSFS